MNLFARQLSQELRRLLVCVNGDPPGGLRRPVQPRGVGRADVDPRTERTGEIANCDCRFIGSRPREKLDALGELQQVREQAPTRYSSDSEGDGQTQGE